MGLRKATGNPVSYNRGLIVLYHFYDTSLYKFELICGLHWTLFMGEQTCSLLSLIVSDILQISFAHLEHLSAAKATRSCYLTRTPGTGPGWQSIGIGMAGISELGRIYDLRDYLVRNANVLADKFRSVVKNRYEIMRPIRCCSGNGCIGRVMFFITLIWVVSIKTYCSRRAMS